MTASQRPATAFTSSEDHAVNQPRAPPASSPTVRPFPHPHHVAAHPAQARPARGADRQAAPDCSGLRQGKALGLLPRLAVRPGKNRVAFNHYRSLAEGPWHKYRPLSQEELAEITGTRIPGNQGIGGLVSSLALQMPKLLGDCAAADGTRLGTAVVDLLSATLATRLGRGSAVPYDSRQRALTMRIHAFIEQRLPDPGLSPATIAAAHHISPRYLYKLFETQQTTVADWIRRRRLERCRRDLLDPALMARPVSAIAARWGFPNPAAEAGIAQWAVAGRLG